MPKRKHFTFNSVIRYMKKQAPLIGVTEELIKNINNMELMARSVTFQAKSADFSKVRHAVIAVLTERDVPPYMWAGYLAAAQELAKQIFRYGKVVDVNTIKAKYSKLDAMVLTEVLRAVAGRLGVTV